MRSASRISPVNVLLLKELLHSGLITQERESRCLIYRAAFDRMNELVAYQTANCCQGETRTAASAPCSG